PAVVLWPNADAGAEHVARGIRKFREHEDDSQLHFFKNLSTETYVRLMQRSACIVGNSSSAIREGSFVGTPAVNIGTRQRHRQRGTIEAAKASATLTDVVVSTDEDEIAAAAADVQVLRRPSELAADDTPMRDVVLHTLDACGPCEIIVLLQPTSPLRRSTHID